MSLAKNYLARIFIVCESKKKLLLTSQIKQKQIRLLFIIIFPNSMFSKYKKPYLPFYLVCSFLLSTYKLPQTDKIDLGNPKNMKGRKYRCHRISAVLS